MTVQERKTRLLEVINAPTDVRLAVDQLILAAQAEQREKDAQLAEKQKPSFGLYPSDLDGIFARAIKQIAAAIRKGEA